MLFSARGESLYPLLALRKEGETICKPIFNWDSCRSEHYFISRLYLLSQGTTEVTVPLSHLVEIAESASRRGIRLNSKSTSKANGGNLYWGTWRRLGKERRLGSRVGPDAVTVMVSFYTANPGLRANSMLFGNSSRSP